RLGQADEVDVGDRECTRNALAGVAPLEAARQGVARRRELGLLQLLRGARLVVADDALHRRHIERPARLAEEVEAALHLAAPVPAREDVRRRVGVAGGAAEAVDLLGQRGVLATAPGRVAT